MSNTATKENIEEHELTPYQIEQPIAVLLGDYSRDILFPSDTPANQTEKQTIERMASSAVSSIELWSRGVSFLIWKASVSDDVCEQTISSMGSAADALSCFSSMVQPLSDLKRIQDLGEKAELLRVVPSTNSQADTSRGAALEAKNEALTMLGDLEALVSTSMHRVMDGLENENPVSTDTLIGLFSGITRNTLAIRDMVEKIKMH